ncbi:hypothetical protein ACVW00_004084 [Marmoricola sp. URHA0025 HA25]
MLLASATALVIWLSWRQHRVHIMVLSAALLAFTAALLLTGPPLADAYARDAQSFLAWATARRPDRTLYTVGTAAGFVLPALVGAFWGAPMIARELEAGTHRLVWTQGVTRDRWLAAKAGLGLLGVITATGVMALGLTWWAHPIDKVVNATGGSDGGSVFGVARISPDVFASRGLVPIGYAALAFTLGVLAGAVIRRTVPAMAVTLAAYVVLQVVMPGLVRTHLDAPHVATTPITAETLHGIRGHGGDQIDDLVVDVDTPGGWVLSTRTVDGSGKPVRSYPSWVSTCLPPPPAPGAAAPQQVEVGPREQACFERLAGAGYGEQVRYHPASQYWALQWRETGLLLAGSAGLVVATFWRVRRLS